MVGRQISHYRILEPLGEGGMSAVYLAEDLAVAGRRVAIKVMKSSDRHSDDASFRFEREAEAISKIDDPHVVTLHELIRLGDERFIVMQHVDGGSLRGQMKTSSMSVADAITVAIHVGSGLGAAHQLGIFHRDVKPENVLVASSGRCKITDFGVAHLLERSTLTTPGAQIGTWPYMAPEQVQGKAVDARTDVYALGVMLYEMLAGRRPFEPEHEGALQYQIVHQNPPPLERQDSPLPARIVDIVTRAMAKAPDDRYPNIAEMVRDLEQARAHLAQPETALDRLFQGAAWLLRDRRARWAAGVLAVSVAVWLIRPVPSPRPAHTRVMVMKWEVVGAGHELDWLSSGIMDCLIRSLAGHQGFSVISRHTVAAALQAAALQAADITTAGISRAGALGAAHRVGASYLVSGTIDASSPRLQVSCELTDLRSGTVVDSWVKEMGEVKSGLYPTVEAFAADIAGALETGAPPSQSARESVSRTLSSSIEALRYFQQAVEAQELGNIPSVLDFARRAVAADSTFADAHALLARVDPDVASRDLHLSLAMRYRFKASRATARIIEAEDRVAHDDVEGAVKLYEELLAGDPEHVVARSSLAGLYLSRRDFADAVGEYEVLRSFNPFDFSYYPDWAFGYLELGRKDKALNILEQWHRQFPAEVAPLKELIYAHEHLGDYALALSLCDSLRGLSPGADLRHRGFILISLGRLHEAERNFQSLRTTPDRFGTKSSVDSYLAYLAYRSRDYSNGLQLIERAKSEQPTSYNEWLGGLLAIGAGRAALAESCAAAIASQFLPADADTAIQEARGERRFYYHLRAMMYLSQGRAQEAVRTMDLALKFTTRSDDPYFRTEFGRVLLAAGDARRAEAEFRRALTINPNYPETLLGLGEAQIKQGNSSDAQRTLAQLSQLWKEADADDPLNARLKDLVAAATSHHESPSPGGR